MVATKLPHACTFFKKGKIMVFPQCCHILALCTFSFQLSALQYELLLGSPCLVLFLSPCSHFQTLVQRIPIESRTPQFCISPWCINFKWGKSVFAESIVAPALPSLKRVRSCTCSLSNGPKINGHLISRDWPQLPVCKKFALCGGATLAQRTHPSVDTPGAAVKAQTERMLKSN